MGLSLFYFLSHAGLGKSQILLFCFNPRPLSTESDPATVHSRPCPHLVPAGVQRWPTGPGTVWSWVWPVSSRSLLSLHCPQAGLLAGPQTCLRAFALAVLSAGMPSLGIHVACFFTSSWDLMKCLIGEAFPALLIKHPHPLPSLCTCLFYDFPGEFIIASRPTVSFTICFFLIFLLL